MPYRLACKHLFLTYPQCPLSKEEGLELLRPILLPFDPSYVCIASELHEDGNSHLHVLALLRRKLNTRNARYFDLGAYHGNYQAARNPSDVRDYVTKDGNFLEEGEFEQRKRKRDEYYSEALAAQSREEAEEILRTNAPRDYFMGFGNISKCLDKVFSKTRDPYESSRKLSDFNLPSSIWDWHSESYQVCLNPSLKRLHNQGTLTSRFAP